MRVPVQTASAVILAVAVAALAASTAAAASNRAWVSGRGTDQAGCGAPTSPCRSLQYAHDNAVNAGGEIDILDPAGYGAIVITKSVSIVNDGVGTAGVQASSGNAITIAAGPSDAIFLKGLDVDGVQRTGHNGVEFDSGGRLVIDRCVIKAFGNQGVIVFSTASAVNFEIYNSLVTENGNGGTNAGMGVAIAAQTSGPVAGVLDHDVIVNNDAYGVWLSATGGGPERIKVAISNSNVSHDAYGVVVATELSLGEGSAIATVDNSTLDANRIVGLGVFGSGGRAHLSRSVLDENGFDGVGLNEGGVAYTAGDNHIEENAMPTNPTLIPDIWR